jgi:hypothetical protein
MSERGVRIFFIFSGLLYVALLIYVHPPLTYSVPQLVTSIGAVYFGLMLPKYLEPGRVSYVIWFLWISFSVPVSLSLINYVISGAAVDVGSLIVTGIFTWFLYRSVRRLAQRRPA